MDHAIVGGPAGAGGHRGGDFRRDRATHTQKTVLKPWQKQQWCIPAVGSEFVWRMEDVLDVYALPLELSVPRVCFDECPYQLLDEVREPLPPQPGKPKRQDCEYEREGTCNLFLFLEPHLGWRPVEVTKRRTKQEFAQAMKDLVDVHFPTASLIRVVLDNLNTHTPASLYEMFEPEEARRILRRLAFHYTPKHGSWLNMAELELSVLGRQCLDHRLPTMERVKAVIAPWEQGRNDHRVTIQWRFTTAAARAKLHRLYPSIS